MIHPLFYRSKRRLTFPALTVVLILAAMIERDGYTMIAGMAVLALTLAFFGGILDPDFEILESAG